MARRPVPPGTPARSGIAHVVDLVRAAVPPLHPAGLPFVVAPLAVAVVKAGVHLEEARLAELARAGVGVRLELHVHRIDREPEGRQAGIKVGSVDELVGKLKEAGVV